MADTQFTKPRVVLVEGKADKRFIENLLKYLGRLPSFQIESYEGKDNLNKFLKAAVNEASFKQTVISLGITRDADDLGVEKALQSIRSALFHAGLTESESEITSKNPDLSVAAHIMRASSGRGRLEEMILEAVSENWRMSCINSYWDCLLQRIPDNAALPPDQAKVKLAVFTAAQRIPALEPQFGEPDDEAMRWDRVAHSELNFDHPVYEGLKAFLRSL